jgi:hypothetical protein
MVKYCCEKCGKDFSQKGGYTKHINRKTPCVAVPPTTNITETPNASSSHIKEIVTDAADITNAVPIQEIKNNTKQCKFIDLFCGIGSFHHSFKKLGWECVLSCDIDNAVKETYQANYGVLPLGDITAVEPKNIPSYDILCSGIPCFIEGTLTLTDNGYKSIEDVVLSDKLLTHTGKYQKIVNLQRKIYTGNLFEMKIKYHPEIITATEEHPFYVREKKKNNIFGNPEWKKANELTMNDYFGMVINNNEIIPEFTFDRKINKSKTEQIKMVLDKPDYWFVMGFFIGDGWVQDSIKSDGIRKKHSIRFAINNKDEDEVVEIIRNVLSITDKKSNSGKCKKFGCCNFIWYSIFKKFGKYAYGKMIPEWIQDAPKEFIREFINGYMKADGCIIKGKVLQITTVSSNLAYGLQRLYLKLGHIFSVNKCIRPKSCVIEGRVCNQRDTYCVRGIIEKGRNVYSFIEGNYVWYAPFKITKRNAVEIPVYNFEVEEDNSYVVMNTVVHNCQAFSLCGLHKGFDDKRGTLFFSVMRIVEQTKPKIIIIENVQGLLSHDGGKTFDRIKTDIEKANYAVTYKVLKCSDYGLPQMRKRIFIVGIRKDIELVKHIDKILDLDEYKNEKTLSQLLGKNFEKKYNPLWRQRFSH